MDYVSHYDSPLGGITLAGDGQALTGLWFDGQKYFAATLPGEREERDLPLFQAAARWLDRYFQGEDPGPPPPLAFPSATPFRGRCGSFWGRSPTARPSPTVPWVPGWRRSGALLPCPPRRWAAP